MTSARHYHQSRNDSSLQYSNRYYHFQTFLTLIVLKWYSIRVFDLTARICFVVRVLTRFLCKFCSINLKAFSYINLCTLIQMSAFLLLNVLSRWSRSFFKYFEPLSMCASIDHIMRWSSGFAFDALNFVFLFRGKQTSNMEASFKS